MTVLTFSIVMVGALFAHFIADFVMQSDSMAKNKATDISALCSHVLTYLLGFMAIALAVPTLFGVMDADLFYKMSHAFLTVGLLHLPIDFITSKCTKALFDKGDTHNGFVVIGADQFLHLSSIVILILYFK